jgi:GT2 family glycosyltransferase/glycosyltransferase involved in cell wall biosynthesis
MRVLLIVHGFPPAASGGTEVYVRDLARALAFTPATEVAVLTREADPQRPELAVRRSTLGAVTIFSINNTFQSCSSFADSYENPRLLDVACGLIDTSRPDVVHIQHLTCLSTLLPMAIARRRIPVVLTLNDYWLLCHRGQLFDLDGERCAGPFEGGCARCIPAGALAGPGAYTAGRRVRGLPLPGAARAVQLAVNTLERIRPPAATRPATEARLAHMRDAARHVDRFLAPSRTMADWFRQFGVPDDRMLSCNQGISLTPFAGERRRPSAVLRVAFAGGLIPSKAPHVLLDAVDRLPPGSITVDLLGAGGAYHGRNDYAAALGPRLGHAAIRRLGPVPHERMPAALHDVDAVVVPSVWIENAPFIIREAFAAGAPVVASDLGGTAEMVRHEVDGLLFPAGDAGALAASLRRLMDEPGLLDRLRAGIERPMSIEADAAQLRQLYGELLPSLPRSGYGAASPELAPNPEPRAPSPESRVPNLAAVVLNYRTPDQSWLAVHSLQTSFTPPDRIIVVDNASGDGSAALLRSALPGVDVFETDRNLGFSGGCNTGIRAALAGGAHHVLLVNSDVVLAPDAVDCLLDAMASDAALGIAGPLLVSREEPGRIASAGIAYSRRSGRMRQRGAGRAVASLATEPGRVEAVSGCVMLIRQEVFDRAGLLDEDYFFSFEDIDFCLRAEDAGFRSACVPEAVAYHEGGRTIGRRSTRRVYFATRNHLRLQARVGARTHRAVGAACVIGLNAAYVVAGSQAPLVRGLGAVARGAWHHFRGRYGDPD